MRTAGLMIFAGFVLFVSLKIITPPVEVIQVISSPSGSCEARLMHVFYGAEPGYKISTRTGRLWRTRLYLSKYNDAPVTNRAARLHWSDDSESLFFEINGAPVWEYHFVQESKLKSP